MGRKRRRDYGFVFYMACDAGRDGVPGIDGHAGSIGDAAAGCLTDGTVKRRARKYIESACK